jgi:transcriptional regulator with XRE-family HTH domain
MADKSMDGTGFHSRLFIALSLWQAKHGRRLSQAKLGELIGRLEGEPVPQSTVSDWFNEVVPSVHYMEPLAKALEVDPGWLAFGNASKAPPPTDPGLGQFHPVPPPRKR